MSFPKPLKAGLKRRSLHSIAFISLCLVAIDTVIFDSEFYRPEILDPLVWFLLYAFAALTVAVFIYCGSLRSLQMMTVVVASIGILRGFAFYVDDSRLTPLGLNSLIALYAILAHKYERLYIKE